MTGMKADFSQKLLETSIGFSLHSLLVVDAVQTYGTDYELLVASHQRIRCICALLHRTWVFIA